MMYEYVLQMLLLYVVCCMLYVVCCMLYVNVVCCTRMYVF